MGSRSRLSSFIHWSPAVAVGMLALQTLACAPGGAVNRATIESEGVDSAPTSDASVSADTGSAPLPDPNPDAATGGIAGMDGQIGESDPLPGSALDASPPPTDVPPPDTLPSDTRPPDTLPRDTLSPDVVRASPLGGCVGLAPWQDGTSYQPGARVTNLTPRRLYECRSWPSSEWCGLVTYEPGISLYWSDAWIYRGLCP